MKQVLLGILVAVLSCNDALSAPRQKVSYGRDVQPILARHCYACHGPDSTKRKADLRLDDLAGVAREVIAPGQPDKSELMRRLTTRDVDERMPPQNHPTRPSSAELGVIRQWILEGAGHRSHWAFTVPIRPALPSSTDRQTRNPIDRLVERRLVERDLRFSARADRATLIRRVTFDLIGLPPTPEEVRVFVNDRSPDAYERLVDRLLASPKYGERMAVPWLDAARYADTHGYLFDTERSMWRWRDWVIDALNRNQPFDSFTVEQLAGDLLPGATPSQRIASGFNRNHLINNEAGANPQEYLVENVIDRVNTTATVWLGLSMACCQCHDHKYDPLTQKEYYGLYAYFNEVPEVGLDGLNTNAKPIMKAPSQLDTEALAGLKRRLNDARKDLQAVEPQIATSQAKWEQSVAGEAALSEKGLVAHWKLDGGLKNEVEGGPAGVHEAAAAKYKPGLDGKALSLNGLGYVNAGDVFDFGATKPLTLSAWIRLRTKDGRMSIFSRMLPSKDFFRGYTLQLFASRPSFFLINKFPGSMIQVQATTKFEAERWYHLAVTYDGSGKAAGVKLYLNGKLEKPSVSLDKLEGGVDARAKFWIGNGHPGAKFKGTIDDARVYDRVLGMDEIQTMPGLSIDSLLAVPLAKRNDEQKKRVRRHFMMNAASPIHRKRFNAVSQLAEQLKKRERAVPTVMVMARMPKPRATRLLQRGAFDKPGEIVRPATPRLLAGVAEKAPGNRLELARWIVHPRHPLTSRVQVNRYWQLFFGQGLVRTPGDFGVQGDRPSHPQLLDWLAVRFIESGWDVKAMHRLIVTSRTYQQTAKTSDALRRVDPTNRWLARGPRNRLAAEFVRDQALFAGGLLVDTIHGQSVRPYQPSGLWREVAFDFSGGNLTAQVYRQGQGADLYRRSLYTFWKRTAPPPTMLLFDAPDRERCVVKREQTHSPLQALVLLNDPTFVEAARGMAERAVRAKLNSNAERVKFLFRSVLTRSPADDEVSVLQTLFERQRRRFVGDAAAAKGLLAVGSSRLPAGIDRAELAAWTVVSSVILNLDESINK